MASPHALHAAIRISQSERRKQTNVISVLSPVERLDGPWHLGRIGGALEKRKQGEANHEGGRRRRFPEPSFCCRSRTRVWRRVSSNVLSWFSSRSEFSSGKRREARRNSTTGSRVTGPRA